MRYLFPRYDRKDNGIITPTGSLSLETGDLLLLETGDLLLFE